MANRKFVQIKVEFEVSLPLKTRFLFSRFSGNQAKISSKYEKLYNFYYHYGRIGHSINSYGELESLFEIHYGSELRADPWDVRKINRSIFFAPNSNHQ